MNDQLSSLTRIFTEQLFRIPDYQRGYAWGEKEVAEFWDDLIRLQPNKNHYVGVLTLERVDSSIYRAWIDDIWLIDSKRFTSYYIVDGQQRLTTSIILVQAIINSMRSKNISKLNYMTVDEIVKRFIFDSKDDNYSKSYIFSYETDNPSYDYLIERIYCSNPIKITDETVYTQNLEFALKFFTKKISELDIPQLEQVFKKVTQNFLFNTYEISSDIDVFVTFETMNNRGKRLSYLELLKNRLIYLSTLFDSSDDIKDRLRRDINLCWKDIYFYLGINKKRKLADDEFLNAHFQMFFYKDIDEIYESEYGSIKDTFSDVPSKYLLSQYFIADKIHDGQLSINEIFQYNQSLKNTASLWNLINNPEYSQYGKEIKEYLKKLNHITFNDRLYNFHEINYSKVFLLACLDQNPSEKTLFKLLKALERYLFVYLFYTNPGACSKEEVAHFIYEFNISKIKKREITLDKLAEHLNQNVDTFIATQHFRKNIVQKYNRIGFYSYHGITHYILSEYEYSLMVQSKSQLEKVDRDIFFKGGFATLEHIYPRNARNQYWKDMFGNFQHSEREKLRDSLGNLVLISKEKNGKLANLSFPDKKENKYNKVGYMYGSYSELELCSYDKWSPSEILDRGLRLVNFIVNRWQLNIFSSKQEKICFLGLGFLNNISNADK